MFFGGGLPRASLDLLAHAKLTQNAYKAYKAYTKQGLYKAYAKLIQAYTKLIQSTCKAYTKRRKAYTKLMQSLHKAYTTLNFNRFEKINSDDYQLVCFWLPGVSWDLLVYTKLAQAYAKLAQSCYEAYTNRIPSLMQSSHKAYTMLIQCLYEAYAKLIQSMRKANTKLSCSVL